MKSAQDLRTKEGIISVRHGLDIEVIEFFWKKYKKLLHAFSNLQITTAHLKSQEN